MNKQTLVAGFALAAVLVSRGASSGERAADKESVIYCYRVSAKYTIFTPETGYDSPPQYLTREELVSLECLSTELEARELIKTVRREGIYVTNSGGVQANVMPHELRIIAEPQ